MALSACQDYETSTDTGKGGVLTGLICETLETLASESNVKGLTVAELFEAMTASELDSIDSTLGTLDQCALLFGEEVSKGQFFVSFIWLHISGLLQDVRMRTLYIGVAEGVVE